jgi:hypothetical protein
MIHLVIALPESTSRSSLHRDLVERKMTEAQFITAVLLHGPSMPLTSEQWFNFMSRIPNKLLRREKLIISKLSKSHREKLGI